MNSHPATFMASNPEGARWFKSSYSNGGGECVEAAHLTHATACERVAVRDSKESQGPALRFTAEGWGVFVSALQRGGLSG